MAVVHFKTVWVTTNKREPVISVFTGKWRCVLRRCALLADGLGGAWLLQPVGQTTQPVGDQGAVIRSPGSSFVPP